LSILQTEDFFSASNDGKIVCWEQDTGRNQTFSGERHPNKIIDFCISGGNLVSVSVDSTFKTTPLSTLAYPKSEKIDGAPLWVTDAGNGNTFIVCSNKIITVNNGQVTKTLDVKWDPTCIASSKDGETVAIGSSDKTIRVFSNSNGNLTEKYSVTHIGAISSVAVSPDGALVAGGDQAKRVVLWKGDQQVSPNSWLYDARVDAVRFSPNGELLAAGSLDSSIQVYSVTNNSLIHEQKFAHRQGVKDVIFYDNNTLITTGQDLLIKSWKVNY